MANKWNEIFTSADILIPKSDIDLNKWSVVACDQYTSEREYWDTVNQYVGDSASTLHMIFPEIYLEDGGFDARIHSISEHMNQYLKEDIFQEYPDSFLYVKRTLGNQKVRHGIMGKIDLEHYDYSKGSTSAVRATEGTVLERIPPRVKVRQECPLEAPHIMVLIDDASCEIIEGIAAHAGELTEVYDSELMNNSGHVTGYLLDSESKELLQDGIQRLVEEQQAKTDLVASPDEVLLYAVGDGNHSLATAKKCYENLKARIGDEALTSKARYALVELVNLHDASLEFEAIHRVMFQVDPQHVTEKLNEWFQASHDQSSSSLEDCDFMTVINGDMSSYKITQPTCNLAVGDLQKFIDSYIENYGGTVDYIHGESVVEKLCQEEKTIGFLLNCMEKTDLYKTVILDGALPRKTFSMGEAADKRFYLEMREIL